MFKNLIPGSAYLVVAICLMTLLGVAFTAITGDLERLSQLADTVLWRYTWTTLILVGLVAGGSIVVGAVTAWLVVTT